ncbi:protein argonaute-4 isoform X2 [Ctenocephalides felis]|uniref:protein argonaute-4 isoform X2 n=1 Tax=Ctenocephalides felis TaxID=7515 RepID=UPI000E6E555C|nr:protein argonaute-4 isoform X2 [Ctenocephalides felis]
MGKKKGKGQKNNAPSTEAAGSSKPSSSQTNPSTNASRDNKPSAGQTRTPVSQTTPAAPTQSLASSVATSASKVAAPQIPFHAGISLQQNMTIHQDIIHHAHNEMPISQGVPFVQHISAQQNLPAQHVPLYNDAVHYFPTTPLTMPTQQVPMNQSFRMQQNVKLQQKLQQKFSIQQNFPIQQNVAMQQLQPTIPMQQPVPAQKSAWGKPHQFSQSQQAQTSSSSPELPSSSSSGPQQGAPFQTQLVQSSEVLTGDQGRRPRGRGRGAPSQKSVSQGKVGAADSSKPAEQSSAYKTQPVPPTQTKTMPSPETPQPMQTTSQQFRPPAQTSPVQEKVVSKTCGMELPTRKKRYEGGGQLGRKIQVRTNFMPLNLKNICKMAIHYDITFDPDKPKRFLKLAFNKFCTTYFPNRYPAFDGVKNVYASSPLPKVGVNVLQGEVSIINPDNELEKKYKVTIKFASYVDMTSLSKYMENGSSIETPQEALQCIDIIFRHALSKQFVQVGKSFFTPPSGRIVSLGDGMDLWYGLFSSCVLGWKPYLNVDVAHKGFPTKQLVTEYMMNEKSIDLTRPVDPRMIEEVRKFIKSLKVIYQIPGKPTTKRSFRVNDIRNLPAEQEKFEDENKREITVVRYYRESKGYSIRYPKLPCLWVGSRAKNVFVPPELCTIQEGQVVLKKLTELQTRNMIKCAATPTDMREKKIMDAFNNSKIENHPAVKEFNLSIDSKFERVDARVLDPPILEYAAGKVVTPREGVWKSDREKFLKAVNIQNWTVLNLDFRTRNDRIEYFCTEMTKLARQVGISINPPRPPITLDTRRLVHDLPEYFKKAKQDKIELVFVIISQDDSYCKVKQTAELQFGILTQCVKGNTLNKLTPSTCHNILLKVNAKLNGTNYQLSSRIPRRPFIFNHPVMIVGADVTHPSPDQTDIPSVVGVAASHDPNAFKYNMIWRLQLPKIEIIEDLHSIMREHLLKFYKETHQKPQRIYFFRDGVSEGQFKQVLNSEFVAIRRACQSLENNYQPPITMLVVQKRHHTRFFPFDQDAVGRNKNVPPGTVVDQLITHPTERDFYLVSHQSIQGVARPTKYKVLWDDNDMTEDQLQELTYFLCHMFSRCTRAVSYPTPTYYAHLAAYRGRIYIEGKRIQLNDLQREQDCRRIQDDVQKNKPMFFV